MAFEIKKNVLKQYIPEPGQTEVVIPEGVDTIGTKAFEDCGELNSVILPEGVTALKQYAFDSCEPKIKHLAVPATLQESEKNSFPAELRTVDLPNGTVRFARGHDSFEVTEVIIYLLGITEKSFSELRAGSRLELAMISLEAPALIKEDARTEISQYAQVQKKKILEIILSYGLTSALGGAMDAGFITTKNVDACLAQAAGNAEMTAMLLDFKNKLIFSAKAGQKNAYEPESAFRPLSVTEAKKNWSFEKNEDGTGYILTSYKGAEFSVEIPATIGKLPVTEIQGICNCSFSSKFPHARQSLMKSSIVSVSIPNSVQIIGEYSFDGLAELKTVCISSGVTHICKNAFAECAQLEEILLPTGLESVDYRAFGNCTALKQVIMPDTVTYINDFTFEKCDLLSIHAPAGSYAEQYAKEHNICFVAE